MIRCSMILAAALWGASGAWAAPPTMENVTPAGASTGGTWSVFTGTQAFVFDAADADGDLASLDILIFGPTPYDTVAGARTLHLHADSNAPATPEDLALLAYWGSSVAYDTVGQSWTLTLDTLATWGPEVDDPNDPYYDPNISAGDAVWPAGEYGWQLELRDAAGNTWGDNATPYWPPLYPSNPAKAEAYLYYFHTISSAIGGFQTAPGDTIAVGGGTFVEQVTIANSLVLAGAGVGSSVIQAPATMNPDADGMRYIVTVGGAGSSVEMHGFTITGPGPSAGLTGGVFVRDGAYLDLHDNEILDIRDEPFGGAQRGVGVQVGRQYVGTTGSANIHDNTIRNYQKIGIVVDNAGSDALITNNTIIGHGATNRIAQNGIQIGRDATATVNGNAVSDNEYTGASWWSGGILVFDTSGVSVSGNTLTANNAGIWLTAFDAATTACTVTANTCDNNADTAIILQGALVNANTVEENHLDGNPIAIWLAYCSNNTIHANTITNTTNNGIYLYQADDNTIENNLVDHTTTGTGAGWGVALYGDASDTSDNNIIRANTIANGDVGVWIGNGSDGTLVQGNYLSDNLYGVKVTTYGSSLEPTNTTLTANAFSGNTLAGLLNTTAQTVAAEDNWWGDVGGPRDADSDDGESDETDPNACPGTPATERNADGTGDAVEDTSTTPVDYCPWATQFARLTLEPDADCYAPGQTVTVELWMRDQTEAIVGGEFFLAFDPNDLAFVALDSNDPPFDTILVQDVDPNAGTIDYAVSAPLGDPGSTGAARMAVLTFTAQRQLCDAPDLLVWRIHDPPSRLSAFGGGAVTPLLEDLDVRDTQPPTITGFPADQNLQCPADIPPADPNLVSATDNCGAVTITYLGDNDLGGAGCAGDPHIITRTYRATDACGNQVEQTQTFTCIDTTPPVVTCPPEGDLSVPADAGGGCGGAVVTFAGATANDHCDGTLSVNYDPPSGSTFPVGTTQVTCSAVDSCGNVGICTFQVEVRPVNELAVNVELQGAAPGPFVRCITFDLWHCGQTAVTTTGELTFTNGLATGVLEVPCGDYDCITARDALHTLRVTDEDDFGTNPVVGTQYVADFTDRTGAGGDDDTLVGGNLNDDGWIDILDFGVLTAQWNQDFGTGDTDCTVTPPHADISGDGIVSAEDFTFIQVNFLAGNGANCCGEPGNLGDGPTEEISVADLRAMGLAPLAAGDLNRDGWLDAGDIAAFMQGARPGTLRSVTPTRRVRSRAGRGPRPQHRP